MKKILCIAFLFSGLVLSAQTVKEAPHSQKKELREKMKDWSPEQHAELRSKKIALHLDLTAEQQAQAYEIELAQATKRANQKDKSKSHADMTPDELFELKQRRLDAKIQLKEAYKRILTPEQFEKLERSHGRRRGAKQHKSRKNH
ncbi:MAG: hypothetical protein R3359_08675 [Marinirhabdus sp.]|nr:hypothetical protein [Marinirhabdus sp.]